MRGFSPALRKRKRCLPRWDRQKRVRQRSAGRRETDPGKVDNQIYGTTTSYSCLVIEPAASCDDDVVICAPGTERRAFPLNLKPIMLQHIAERNDTHLVGKLRDFHL